MENVGGYNVLAVMLAAVFGTLSAIAIIKPFVLDTQTGGSSYRDANNPSTSQDSAPPFAQRRLSAQCADGKQVLIVTQTIPQSASPPAPFTQGSLGYAVRRREVDI